MSKPAEQNGWERLSVPEKIAVALGHVILGCVLGGVIVLAIAANIQW